MASSRKERRTLGQRFWAAVRLLFILGVCFTGIAIGLIAALVRNYSRDLPDVERLRHYQPSATTRIFAGNGELIATLYRENRTWIPLKDVPTCMRQAIVASEDSRFYEHPGIDPIGMARVLWWVVRRRGLSQGASTITMQLARNVFLSDEVSVKRKVQEMLVAWQLERKFTKDELLEFYLNQIYFGAGAYGIEAAAETYFGKKASALDLAESALIVGVVPAPSDYSPYANPQIAHERQTLVLRRMVEVGDIRPDEAQAALSEPLHLVPQRKDPFVLKYPYFTTYVLREVAQKYGEEVVYRGGLRIYTTLDPLMQEEAQSAVHDGLRAASSQHIGEAALVAIEPKTGFIKAMVGGTGWSDRSQFNRAWQAQRPAGSSFKIFVYSTALENGFSPDTMVSDSPVTFRVGPNDDWSPKNSDGRFMGNIPLHTALQYSRNPVSACLVNALTPARVVDTAYKMGITTHIDAILSIALGAVSVSPMDMASAVSVIANGGERAAPCAIKLIEDADGKVVEDHRHPAVERVLSPITAFAMTEMMEGVVNGGTGYAARLRSRPAAGKTGTTDVHRDAWFVGFVPQLAAAVWVGNDDDSQMYGTFGGDVPAPIWRNFMESALARQPVLHFGADANGNVKVAMCRESHLRATSLCPDPEIRSYHWDGVPQRFCATHIYAGTGTVQNAPASPRPSLAPTTEDASPSPDADIASPSPNASPTPLGDGRARTPQPDVAPTDEAPSPTPLDVETPGAEEDPR